MDRGPLFIFDVSVVNVLNLHGWDVGLAEARRIQEALSRTLVLEGGPESVTRVAGADVSYNLGSDEVWAGVVVFDIRAWETVEEHGTRGRMRFSYVPGYLSFREMPVLLKAFEKIQTVPDVVLLDGQGIAHPRRMGIASHVGLFLERPTVGCAKSRLVGVFEPVGTERGARSELMVGDERVGYVLRTREGVKPIFVSPGHRICSEKAAAVALASCGRYRLPEPIRRAHILVNRMRRGMS